MNRKLLKKYQTEFNAWVEGESLLYLTTRHPEWKTASICIEGLFSNPVDYIKGIVIDDKFVEFRKALVEGKTVQSRNITHYLCSEPVYGPWIDTEYSSFLLGSIDNYRIKPEVGDWVQAGDGGPFQVTQANLLHGTEHLTCWQPQPGEVCIFWDNGSDYAAVNVFSNPTKWDNCMPFTGDLPPNLKD